MLLSGLTLPLADAVLSRITALAVPFGADDDRTAGKLRLDAAVDLLLGRTGRPAGECAPAGGPLPFPDADADDDGDGSCSGGCGCPLGAAVPCGAQVTVLVPLATALGHGDVPAQAPGGPLEPDLLAALLSAAPVLRGVWVDPDGVPVADSPIVVRPERGDADSVRWALRRIVEAGPGERQPRHPDDHPPDDQRPPERPPDDPPGAHRLRGSLRAPGMLGHPHPPGTPGPYRPPGRLRRFLHARAPRCEWPGCGTRAARCDLDHDLAHPHGPTCACNLGPLCRRRHRTKQAGFTKQRTADGVLWTGPTRQQILSPNQHLDVPGVRPVVVSPLEQLSHRQHAEVLHLDGAGADSHAGWQAEDRSRAHRWWLSELRTLRRVASAGA